ncbi:MAG: hypothetical protein AAB649_06715, partial [Patescibacteria group bacterium]
LIIILAAIFLWFSWGKYVDWQAQKENNAAIVAQQVLKQQVADNVKLAEIVRGNEQRYVQLLNTVTAQNQQLVNAMAARDRVTAQQQEANKTLPLPELAFRWQTLIKVPPTEIKNVNNELVVSPVAAVATVNQLEEIPRLEGNLADEKAQSANKDELIKEGTVNVTGLTGQVTGLKTEIVKQAVLNKAEQDKMKADQKKKSRNWFLRGLAIGGAVVVYAAHALGAF